VRVTRSGSARASHQMGNADSKQVRGEYVAPELPPGVHEVRVSVYKLPFAIGTLLGGFHSGVVVHGREWSFGGGQAAGTGVYECEPEMNMNYKFKERIPMGTTERPAAEVDAIVAEMKQEWPMTCYQLLEHNCNHFTNALLLRLLGKPAPFFINKLGTSSASYTGPRWEVV
jgi:hypothetical protein